MEIVNALDAIKGRENGSADAGHERQLWIAVLALAVEDWTNGTLRAKRDAQRFLFESEKDFQTVCGNAGLDAAAFRAQLLRIGRKIQMEGTLRYPLAA